MERQKGASGAQETAKFDEAAADGIQKLWIRFRMTENHARFDLAHTFAADPPRVPDRLERRLIFIIEREPAPDDVHVARLLAPLDIAEEFAEEGFEMRQLAAGEHHRLRRHCSMILNQTSEQITLVTVRRRHRLIKASRRPRERPQSLESESLPRRDSVPSSDAVHVYRQ